MKVKATGKVGCVYTTKTGQREYNFASDEGEYAEGWEQVTEFERRKVKRKRISHSMIMWEEVSDDLRPFSHREDGPIA